LNVTSAPYGFISPALRLRSPTYLTFSTATDAGTLGVPRSKETYEKECVGADVCI